VRTVFLDTVGLIALWNKSDQWHSAATNAFQSLPLPSIRLVTTSLVLLECANDAARKPYRKDVVGLRDSLIQLGDLVDPTEAEVAQAWSDFAYGNIGSPGVVDLVSFSVMRRLGILEAFTHDRHFSAAGFVELF
jgi:predicted nucleic acid-binding protein